VTNPRNATTARGGKRFYTWQGESFWSVTTILDGSLSKRALINWAANEVAAFACDNNETIARLLTSGERDAAYDMLKRSPWRKKEKAADLGSSIHAAVEAHVLGKPMPPWGILERPYMLAFVKFLDDMEPTFLATEASVYSRSQRYAGTLDAIVQMRLPLNEYEQKFIMDVKSGKGVYEEVGLQLVAYRRAEFIGLPDGSEAPMPEVDGCLVLHLAPSAYRLIEVRADDLMYKTFLYCRELFRFAEEIKQTVLVQEYAGEAKGEVTAA
jgi:hypothetical protein